MSPVDVLYNWKTHSYTSILWLESIAQKHTRRSMHHHCIMLTFFWCLMATRKLFLAAFSPLSEVDCGWELVSFFTSFILLLSPVCPTCPEVNCGNLFFSSSVGALGGDQGWTCSILKKFVWRTLSLGRVFWWLLSPPFFMVYLCYNIQGT